MGNEIDKLQQAKMFMDYLANGIDPVSNTDADTETLRNEQIIACFRYISDILARDIYQAETDIKKNDAFYITEEQLAELNVYSYNCKVSELANEINRVTVANRTKKLPATWINDWLEAEGYLCQSDLKSRIATEKGKQLGITTEYCRKDDGTEYYINLYTAQAQGFVFMHLNEIIAFRNERNSQTEEKIPCIEYPYDLSIREFIKQHPDKCFIMSIGSCDSVAKIGSYIAILLFKGKSKVLKRSNIPTNSANKCILTGIIDAVSAIKMPTDVIILSSTPLGFNTPKSKNYRFCQEIYRVLTEKECRITVAVCHGKGYELNSFVKSLA